MPITDTFRLEGISQPVAGFCLAVTNRSGSSFLFSKEPISQLNGVPIGVAAEAGASRDLLRVILALKYDLQPEALVSLEDSPPAFLLTGNQALRRRRGLREYPNKYDLGEEWHTWTGLPFVFARWMRRNDLSGEDAALLEDTLYVGLEDGVDGLYHLSEPRENLLMLAKDIMEYIQGVRYFIGFSEQKAIDLFRKYWEQAGGAV
jgi:chorismate dehydratase